ncbi:MAG: TRAP transporter small permease subunit [Burkholderiaceae bacterium]
MNAVVAFSRAITGLNVLISRIMSPVVLLLFLFLLGDVIMRYVTQSPVAWSAQISKLIYGVYAIIGGGYLLARRDHVNVDLFYGKFSARRKAIVDIVTSLLFFLFVGVLLYESFWLAMDSVARWEKSYETIWLIPIWPSKVMIPVAATLLLLQGIVKLIADFMIVAGIDVDETAFGPVNDDTESDQELG